MCFATAAAIAGVAGAGITAAGSIFGGNASAAAANYQSQVASNNAIIANQNAVRAEQAGLVQTQNQGQKGAAASGRLKVIQGTSGVDVNSGSSVDVQAGERMTNQLDTETVFQNAMLKSYGYRVQATNFESESQLDKMKAGSDEEAGYLKAAGGLLSSASSIGGKWGNSPGGGGGASGPVYAPDDI